MNIKFKNKKSIDVSDDLANLAFFAPDCELCGSKNYKLVHVTHQNTLNIILCNSCKTFARLFVNDFNSSFFLESSKFYFDKAKKINFSFSFLTPKTYYRILLNYNCLNLDFGAAFYENSVLLPDNIGKLATSDIQNFSSIIQNYLLLE